MVYSPCYPFVKRTLSHGMISRLYVANGSESNTGQLLRTDQFLICHFIYYRFPKVFLKYFRLGLHPPQPNHYQGVVGLNR